MRDARKPVFGFIEMGGLVTGAMLRDVRLANELAARGHPVHVWWTMDRHDGAFGPGIQHHWLFSGFRYRRRWLRGPHEALGRLITLLIHERRRIGAIQKRKEMADAIMVELTRVICDGIERDPVVVDRLVRGIERTGVTHLMTMLGLLGPIAQAAAKRLEGRLRYLVTFQAHTLYAQYAQSIGRKNDLYARIRESVRASGYPAVAVSDDYRQHVIDDIGFEAKEVASIPPGVPPVKPMTRDEARQILARSLKRYDPSLPLVTFMGRRDVEKGIDLLLYAAAIVRRRGVPFQLGVCGPTLFGKDYRKVCVDISRHLEVPVRWHKQVRGDFWTALLTASHCVVYPSIFREPFGMVPVEAMAHGTPAVVGDWGGHKDAVEFEGHAGGLRFAAWDSGDLADKLELLLRDAQLWRRLADDGPTIARHYSVTNLADRVLRHLEIES